MRPESPPLTVSLDVALPLISMVQIWTNCAPDADRASKTSETRPILRAHKFCLVKKEKSLDL